MFKKKYTNKEIFDKWLKLLPGNLNELNKFDFLICPYCGKKGVGYLYIGSKIDRIGYLQSWCNFCYHGIYMSRARIPEGAKMIEMKDKTINISSLIPEYEIASHAKLKLTSKSLREQKIIALPDKGS